MTDYERTTTRETTTTPPVAPTVRRPARRSGAPLPRRLRSRPASAPPIRRTSRPGPVARRYAARIVTFLFGILQVLLILRIVLLLLVANRGNDVVQFVLNVTQPFVDPFIGMFSLNRVTADQGSVLDVAAIVALIAWTLVEALILAAIRIFSRRTTDAGLTPTPHLHTRTRLRERPRFCVRQRAFSAAQTRGQRCDLGRSSPAAATQPGCTEVGP